jgi:hypothetical protein
MYLYKNKLTRSCLQAIYLEFPDEDESIEQNVDMIFQLLLNHECINHGKKLMSLTNFSFAQLLMNEFSKK